MNVLFSILKTYIYLLKQNKHNFIQYIPDWNMSSHSFIMWSVNLIYFWNGQINLQVGNLEETLPNRTACRHQFRTRRQNIFCPSSCARDEDDNQLPRYPYTHPINFDRRGQLAQDDLCAGRPRSDSCEDQGCRTQAPRDEIELGSRCVCQGCCRNADIGNVYFLSQIPLRG